MAVTKNAHIATWTVTNQKLIAREFVTGEFWLCQQVAGTPDGSEDVFVVREPHMLQGNNLVFQSGFTAADASAFKKHIYPGETVDTTTRSSTGFGKGIPLNFINTSKITATPPAPTMPDGYISQPDGGGTMVVVKSQTVTTPASGATAKTTAASTTDTATTGVIAKAGTFLKDNAVKLLIGAGVLVAGIFTFKWLKNR